jgi:(R,R)-butanediol dehydrogenase/meso-butanediol dehydrogenase/diacetyl reductase
LGHEVVGVVERLGSPSDRLRVGDVVAVDGLSGCGSCRWCQDDRIVLCEQLAAIGLMEDGGLAEYCVVPGEGCYVLPVDVDPGSAVLTETLAVGVRALRRARVQPGDEVLVTGGGAVGLMAAQAARALGASRVCVLEPEPLRRRIAAELGLTAVGHIGECDAVDVVIECSGTATVVSQAVRQTRTGGRVVLVGIYSQEASIDVLSLVVGEREILGSLSHHWRTDFATAVELLSSGAVRAEPIVTHRIGIGDALELGLRALADDPGSHLKIVVEPGR